eukprot:TRINITY_DN18193_c0_g1_i1.p1 TRINITY_DN18193_c0_g1~~TRINITY_DN18193_c0_g1_i1.p1  ORF type:complete len:535 (+),score=48.48 TRINITY_DN18193_c0_g1_i1:100-1704(+)
MGDANGTGCPLPGRDVEEVLHIATRLCGNPDDASLPDITALAEGYKQLYDCFCVCRNALNARTEEYQHLSAEWRQLLTEQRRREDEYERLEADRLHLLTEKTHLEEERARIEESREAEAEQRSNAVSNLINTLPHLSRYCRTKRSLLDADDPVCRYLCSEFLHTVKPHRPAPTAPHREAPMLEIVRVEKLQCPRLQDKYIVEIQDEAGLCQQGVTPYQPDHDGLQMPVQTFPGMNLNEMMLFHGAPSHLAERLQQQGLDPRYAGSHIGKLFGMGVYLATHSSKSDIYTQPNADGERLVLVVRACLGEPFFATEAMPQVTKPPERADDRGPLTSVIAKTLQEGGCVEYPEFIVYEKAKVLPQYAIWYRHQIDCFCTHCVRSKVRVRNSFTEDTITIENLPAPATVRDVKFKLHRIIGVVPEFQRISDGRAGVLTDDSQVVAGTCLSMQPRLAWGDDAAAPLSNWISLGLPGPGESKHKISTPAGFTVQMVKQYITDRSGLSPSRQRLLFHGRELQQGRLVDAGVLKGARVSLTVR